MKFLTLSLLLVPALLLASPVAQAGEDDAHAIRMHVDVLLHEAEALQAEGRHDASDVLRRRAHELKERLAERARTRQPTPLTMEQAEKVLHGLEMGLEALEALKRHDELEAVARVADGVRQRMQRARAARQEEHAEVREARRRLEVLRVGFHGLREGEKHEGMERMEHAIHALELRIEGRRDEEAAEIRRTAPAIGEQIELLRQAARIWDGFGHESKARTLRKLAEMLTAQGRHEDGRGREGGDVSREQLERLQVQLHEIRRMVDGLKREVKALQRKTAER